MFVKFNPRRILFLIFIIFALCVLLINIQPARPKNILLISIDTLRADHMGVYGYPKDTTPNIDEWAKKGTVFTNFRTVVPMTLPSFAALMTGKEPVKTRIIVNNGMPINSNNKTLATILSENGYQTGAFLSMGNGINQGINEAENNSFKSYYYREEEALGQESYTQGNREEYEKFILSSVDWLEKNKNEKFFLWVHLMDVHQPYFPPPDLRCKFNSKYCSQIQDESLDNLESMRAKYQSCQGQPVPKDTVEMMETLYDGSIAAADRLVGQILESLENLGIDDDTLIVLYSDHGEGFDHNYYFNHRDVLYESGIKIPLIIINPKDATPKTSNVLIENTDVLPTILDLIGVDRRGYSFDGRSFSSVFSPAMDVLSGKPRDFSISINVDWTKYSITDGQYKYIYSLEGACLNNNEREELFHLAMDSREEKNIAKENPERVEQLKGKLFDYLSDYNLPMDNDDWKDYYYKLREGSSSSRIKFLGY